MEHYYLFILQQHFRIKSGPVLHYIRHCLYARCKKLAQALSKKQTVLLHLALVYLLRGQNFIHGNRT